MFIGIALTLVLLPPMLYFTMKAFERPAYIAMLSYAAVSLIGYYLIFGMVSFFQIYVVIGFGIVLLRMSQGKSKPFSIHFFKGAALPLFLFVVLGFISYNFAVDTEWFMKYARDYAGGVLFIFVVYLLFETEDDIRDMTKLLIVILAMNAALGVLQIFGGEDFAPVYHLIPNVKEKWGEAVSEMYFKPRGFYYMPYLYTKDMLFGCLPALALLAMGYKTRWRTWMAIAVMLSIVGFATCQVRSSQFAFITGVLYVGYRAILISKQKMRILTFAVLLFGVLGLLFAISVSTNPAILYRYTLEDESMFLRVVLVTMALIIIKDHWLWGIGLGNFQAVYYQYLPDIFKNHPTFAGRPNPPHNVFFEMWVSAGIFAPIIYFSIFFTAFQSMNYVSKNSPSHFMRCAAVGYQAFLIGFFVENFLHNLAFDNTYIILVGMAFAMYDITRRAVARENEINGSSAVIETVA